MKKALLVIDMQEMTVGENHANIFKYPADIVARVNRVIDENADSVIIYISNLMRNNIWNKFAPFQCYEGTLQAELVKGLHVNSKIVNIVLLSIKEMHFQILNYPHL